MNTIAELIIRDYLLDRTRPSKNMKPERFNSLSYERWATYEVLKEIIKNPNIPAIITISRFTEKMRRFKDMNPNNKAIFEAGLRVGEDLQDIFNAMH